MRVAFRVEKDPHHAEVARRNLARAGLSDLVELRLGDALTTLRELVSERAGPFDFVFIDADKISSAKYFASALELSRPGTVIVVDNIVRGGAVLDAESEDASIRGARELCEALSSSPQVSATALQTVGSKGYDGFAIAVVTPEAAPVLS